MFEIRKTALETGMEVKGLGLKGPYPTLFLKDFNTLPKDIKYYKVGRRSIENVFVLARYEYFTMYVRKRYSCYRKAYQDVFKDSIIGRDVDHLVPRSTVKNNEFIALGHIDSKINRSHNAKNEAGIIAIKAMNYDLKRIDMITNTPRARELGLFVINGYMKPKSDVEMGSLTEIDIAKLKIKNA